MRCLEFKHFLATTITLHFLWSEKQSGGNICRRSKNSFNCLLILHLPSLIKRSMLNLPEEFVCHFCGSECVSLNYDRSKIVHQKVSHRKKSRDISLLPLCHSVFKLHATRTLHAAKIWRSTPTAWRDLQDITILGREAHSTPIWIAEGFPDDKTESFLCQTKEK